MFLCSTPSLSLSLSLSLGLAPIPNPTPNTKHQTPNAKHQTPNTKHQTPNTTHRPHTPTHPQLGNWLFDSSREYALPFGTDAEKQHSLDLCVRTDDSDDITYEGIVQIEGRLPGMRIIPSGTMLGKRARSH